MGWDVDAVCASSVIKPPGINEAVLRFRGYTDKVRPAEAIYPIVFWGMSAQCRGCDVMALEVAMAQADDPCVVVGNVHWPYVLTANLSHGYPPVVRMDDLLAGTVVLPPLGRQGLYDVWLEAPLWTHASGYAKRPILRIDTTIPPTDTSAYLTPLAICLGVMGVLFWGWLVLLRPLMVRREGGRSRLVGGAGEGEGFFDPYDWDDTGVDRAAMDTEGFGPGGMWAWIKARHRTYRRRAIEGAEVLRLELLVDETASQRLGNAQTNGKGRFVPLDVVKGAVILTWVLVQNGGAGVRLLQSSAWDEGLTIADLLPVWGLWLAGVGAAFSSRLPDPSFNRTQPWERIGPLKRGVRRCLRLFITGLLLNNGKSLSTWRVPGALQALSLAWAQVLLLVLCVDDPAAWPPPQPCDETCVICYPPPPEEEEGEEGEDNSTDPPTQQEEGGGGGDNTPTLPIPTQQQDEKEEEEDTSTLPIPTQQQDEKEEEEEEEEEEEKKEEEKKEEEEEEEEKKEEGEGKEERRIMGGAIAGSEIEEQERWLRRQGLPQVLPLLQQGGDGDNSEEEEDEEEEEEEIEGQLGGAARASERRAPPLPPIQVNANETAAGRDVWAQGQDEGLRRRRGGGASSSLTDESGGEERVGGVRGVKADTLLHTLLGQDSNPSQEEEGFRRMLRPVAGLFRFAREWPVVLASSVVLMWAVNTGKVKDCPVGYQGPGGRLLDAATLWGCTGGLRGSMDRELLGDTHLDQDPPVNVVYWSGPYDGWGILNSFFASHAFYLGLMLCGRVVTTWLVTHLRVSTGHPPSAGLALSLGVRGAALVGLSYYLHSSGTSVWNRWTMSPSYVLLGAGTAQVALVLAYVLTGPSGGAWRGKWQGEPLAAAGRASLLIYIGHTLAKDYLPFSLQQPAGGFPSYGLAVASCVLGVTVWAIVAWQLDKRRLALVL